MNRFFLRLCVPPGIDVSSPVNHARIGKQAGFYGLLLNLLLFSVKLALGLMTHSLAVTADAINNLTDAAASALTFLGFWLARRPADREHPFGHARYEYLSGLAVSVLILLMGFELLKGSVGNIISPVDVELNMLSIVLLPVCAGFKVLMALFYRSVGRHINSETLLVAAKDSRNDAIATTAVLLGSLVSLQWGINMDAWLGLSVALFILWSGISTVRDTASLLLGRPADPHLEKHICSLIRSRKKVLDCHDFLYHDYGQGRSYASVHVEFAASEDPVICHDLIDELEREVYARFHVRLLIHYDPVITEDPELNRLRLWMQTAVEELDEGLSMHDLRLISRGEEATLLFDLSVPYARYGKREEYLRELYRRMEQEGVHYRLSVHFDGY